MQINPNVANLASQNYAKNANANEAAKKDIKEESKEAVALNISTSSEGISSEDLSSIKEKISQIANKLDIDFSKESENFSKNNITFFEGSFLTSQSTNIDSSAFRLLSE